jgi:hypothetical protein
VNLLPGYPGFTRQRGPTNQTLATSTQTPHNPAGLWCFDGKVVVFPRKDAAGNANIVTPAMNRFHKQGGTAITRPGHRCWRWRRSTSQSLTTTVTAGLTRAITGGPRYDRWGQYVYGPAYDAASDTIDVAGATPANDNYQTAGGVIYRKNAILRIDTQGAIAVPTSMGNNMPKGAIDIQFFAGRMLLAGGILNNGGVQSGFLTNHLWYSNPMVSLAGTAADWLDPVTGAYNNILVGDDNASDAIVGMAAAGRSTVVFKRRSVHLLTGAGPSTFSTRVLTAEVGCIDQRSIVALGSSVYWLSQHGLFSYDGATLRNISDGIRSPYVSDMVYNLGGVYGGFDGPIVTGVPLDDENIVWCYANESFNWVAGVEATANHVLLFNARRRDWTVLSARQWPESGGPTQVVAASGQPFAWGWLASVTPYGLAGRIEKWATPDVVDSTAYGGRDGTKGFALGYTSPLLELAGPPYKAKLKRVIIEYSAAISGVAVGTTNTWGVTLTDQDGNTLDSYSLPNQDPLPLMPYQASIYSRDTWAECRSLQVQLDWTIPDSPSGYVPYAAIHGIWVEYEAAQEPHT